jgi:hypothetical protein
MFKHMFVYEGCQYVIPSHYPVHLRTKNNFEYTYCYIYQHSNILLSAKKMTTFNSKSIEVLTVIVYVDCLALSISSYFW